MDDARSDLNRTSEDNEQLQSTTLHQILCRQSRLYPDREGLCAECYSSLIALLHTILDS
jgi:hypothetical protein